MSTKPQTVDFEEALPDGAPILSLPNDSDSLEEIAQKMHALADVVKQGKSLAIHTGFKATPHSERDPVKIALEGMTPLEKDSYNGWSQGLQLPHIDWEKNKEAVPTGKNSAKRFAQRAAAMNIAWKTDKATAEHAAWLTTHSAEDLPILKALVRIEIVKTNLSGGISGQGAMELAEYQTVKKIRSLASKAESKQMQVYRQLDADILGAIGALGGYANGFEPKKPAGEKAPATKVKEEDSDTA